MASPKPRRSVPVMLLFMAVVMLPALYLVSLLKAGQMLDEGPPKSQVAAAPPRQTAEPAGPPRQPPTDPARQRAFHELQGRVWQLQGQRDAVAASEAHHLSRFGPGVDEAYWRAEADRLAEQRQTIEMELAYAETELNRYRCPGSVEFAASCWR